MPENEESGVVDNMTLEPAALRFQIKAFDDLELRELYDILWLRNEVFVVGQKITAEPEVDGRDPECEHVLLHEHDQLVGTARIFHQKDPIVVSRISVRTERQRGGLGGFMMERINRHLGNRTAELHAQAHLEDWYRELGWERVGEEYIEAEIPHVTMVWRGLRVPRLGG